MRQLLLVVMIALFGLGIGLVAWDPTGPYSEFCDLDGLLAEVPPGWDFARDHYNDCAMTLFNESGERAPDELYADVPVDPPPDYPHDWDWLGWVLALGSLVGSIAIPRVSRL